MAEEVTQFPEMKRDIRNRALEEAAQAAEQTVEPRAIHAGPAIAAADHVAERIRAMKDEG